MKKQDLLGLIRAHTENDEETFRRLANQFASEFIESGEENLGREIAAYLSESLSFVPQESSISSAFFRKVSPDELQSAQVFWPSTIYEDVVGITNAVKKRNGVSKFLFYGKPGTGKTETVKVIASITHCELWVVDFPSLVDYRLGETSKNIADMFSQISKSRNLKRVIFLFDELDSIAMNRIDSNDLREMGRATTAFLQGMDSLPREACVFATTNLYESMDKALLRRFDAEISFDSYTRDDLLEIASSLYNSLIKENKDVDKDEKLFRKIVALSDPILNPGEMKNLIRSSIAFAGDDNPNRVYQILLRKIRPDLYNDLNGLANAGLTTREIAFLTGSSKSTVSRRIVRDE